MDWYYAQDNQQAGPVSDEKLAPLIQSGAITPATLVWHSGLAGWQPFATASATLPEALRPAMGAGGAVLDANQALCSQCGQVFPADEVVPLGGYNVCGACKPLLLQKLQQGVPNAGVYGAAAVRYAGFWMRFGAAVVDGLIVFPFSFLFNYLFGHTGGLGFRRIPLGAGRNPFAVGFFNAFGWHSLVLIVLTAIYSGVCLSRFGGMPGMLVCGLRVVRPDGSRITFWRAIGRFAANYLNIVTLYVGYLIIVFDDQKRALHDFVCDTRVIYK